MSVLVKLLSGSQAGAEFTLDSGAYVFGSGEDADLALLDAAVLPRHAVLHVEDKNCRVEPLEGAEVFVDGAPMPAAAPLAFFQVVTLGGVHFAIGPDGPWPSIPALPSAKAMAAANAEGAPAEVPSAEGAAAPVEPPGAATELPDSALAGGKGRIWAIAAGLAVMLSLVFIPAQCRTSPPSAAGLLADRLREGGIRVELAEGHSTGIQAPVGVALIAVPAHRDGQDGAVTVEGLFATEAEAARIAAILEEAKRDQETWVRGPGTETATFAAAMADARTRLRTVADELSEARAHLATEHPHLLLLADNRSPFAAALFGVVENAEERVAAEQAVRASLDARIRLRNSLFLWPDLRREIENAAVRSGIGEFLLDRTNGRLAATANPWPTAREREAFLQRIFERFGQPIAHPLADAFPAERPNPRQAAIQQAESDIGPSTISYIPPPLPIDFSSASASASDSAEPPEESPVDEFGGETDLAAADTVNQADLPELPPEPTADPAIDPAPPAVMQWQVVEVTSDGFVDQHGKTHAAGQYLAPNLRVVRAWSDGVVLQRGRETILAAKGSMIIDDTNEK